MWSIPGKPVSPARFQPFEPVDVLYEFDGPRIFTLWDSEGELNLAYWSDEDDAICRYVIVPTTDKIVAALRQGGISVFDALNQPRCWLCDLTHFGEIAVCQRVEFEAFREDVRVRVSGRTFPVKNTVHALALSKVTGTAT